MPYLIEKLSDAGNWFPCTYVTSAGDLEDFERPCYRATEMDMARIQYRFAQARAARAFKDYLKLNNAAYEAKICIRPSHWPDELRR